MDIDYLLKEEKCSLLEADIPRNLIVCVSFIIDIVLSLE